MTLYHTLAGGTLAVVAILHSVLGELAIIRPLLADERWDVGLPRAGVNRVLRFAWHLTTIAWIGLAAAAMGISGTVVLAAVGLASGLVVVVMLPGHLAWPLFGLAALWAGVAGEVIGVAVLRGLVAVAIATSVAAALLHVAWALGRGRGSLRSAIPTTDGGRPLFAPPPALTIAVAVALLTFAAALAVWVLQQAAPARWVVAVGTSVLALRAVGDGRYAGFTKQVRTTGFARRDDLVFTPVVVLLAFGGVAALAV